MRNPFYEPNALERKEAAAAAERRAAAQKALAAEQEAAEQALASEFNSLSDHPLCYSYWRIRNMLGSMVRRMRPPADKRGDHLPESITLRVFSEVKCLTGVDLQRHPLSWVHEIMSDAFYSEEDDSSWPSNRPRKWSTGWVRS